MRRLVVAMGCTFLAGGVALGALTVAAPAWSQSGHVVTMANMAYGRLPTDLKVGDTVTFINHDTVPHTVTARDKSFDLRLGPGQTGHVTLQKAGSIPFYCIFHVGMRGTLTVAAK